MEKAEGQLAIRRRIAKMKKLRLQQKFEEEQKVTSADYQLKKI